jgi:glycerophosphoryl diester phosphodiesterase
MTFVIAHRGSSALAPENTLAAVTRAIGQGSSVVETDVRRTVDGALVCVHDETLVRTTNAAEAFPDRAPWRVADFTLDEIRTLDAGSWFGPDFAGEAVPTLAEVIDTLGSDTSLLLEVKALGQHPGIEVDVHAELAAIDGYLPSALANGRLVVQSFDHESMRIFRRLAPSVPIGLLFGAVAPPQRADLVAASTWAQQINTHYAIATRDLIESVHELGMSISVYTVDAQELMQKYADLGVDGVITNAPGVLVEVVDRPAGENSPHPR